jgi:hypothetical protein
MQQKNNQARFQFFFCCFCKTSLIIEKSSKGAQGAELKPINNLGCLIPFFSLA